MQKQSLSTVEHSTLTDLIGKTVRVNLDNVKADNVLKNHDGQLALIVSVESDNVGNVDNSYFNVRFRDGIEIHSLQGKYLEINNQEKKMNTSKIVDTIMKEAGSSTVYIDSEGILKIQVPYIAAFETVKTNLTEGLSFEMYKQDKTKIIEINRKISEVSITIDQMAKVFEKDILKKVEILGKDIDKIVSSYKLSI
jgi:rRNA processing protein Gar1